MKKWASSPTKKEQPANPPEEPATRKSKAEEEEEYQKLIQQFLEHSKPCENKRAWNIIGKRTAEIPLSLCFRLSLKSS